MLNSEVTDRKELPRYFLLVVNLGVVLLALAMTNGFIRDSEKRHPGYGVWSRLTQSSHDVAIARQRHEIALSVRRLHEAVPVDTVIMICLEQKNTLTEAGKADWHTRMPSSMRREVIGSPECYAIRR